MSDRWHRTTTRVERAIYRHAFLAAAIVLVLQYVGGAH